MRNKPAFTLIEIIVAVSIMVILMTMFVVGIKYVSASSKEKTTRITLANAQAMLTELETTAGLSRLPVGAFDAPGVVNEDIPNRTNNTGVIGTRDVFAILRSVPNNAKTMNQLPPQQLLTFNNSGSDPLAGVPILLDAWNNPIICVPPPNSNAGDWRDSYGLRGVKLKDDTVTHRVVNPGGLDIAGDTEKASVLGDKTRLSHFRPFFVSAGADGDFRTHDDNIYSFEN